MLEHRQHVGVVWRAILVPVLPRRHEPSGVAWRAPVSSASTASLRNSSNIIW